MKTTGWSILCRPDAAHSLPQRTHHGPVCMRRGGPRRLLCGKDAGRTAQLLKPILTGHSTHGAPRGAL